MHRYVHFKIKNCNNLNEEEDCGSAQARNHLESTFGDLVILMRNNTHLLLIQSLKAQWKYKEDRKNDESGTTQRVG